MIHSTTEDDTVILAFVPDLWGPVRSSRHHILSRLSQHFKILWISPPVYGEHIRSGRTSLKGRGLHRESDRLWVYAPRTPADYKERDSATRLLPRLFNAYRTIWKRIHVATVRRLLSKMGAKQVILYLWRPEYAWTVGRFSEALVAYHVDDDYAFCAESDMPTSEAESALLKRSGVVFIHSRTLMEKKGHYNANTRLLPNGVDFPLFAKAASLPGSIPADIACIPGPRIGYIGYVKRHIDLDLMLQVARQRRDWSIVIIGPVRENHAEISKDVSLLRAEPNVHFVGPKSWMEVPYYTAALDVCLMPYRTTPYTRYIYPVKLHEYLACGKPVVTTRLPNLEEFENVLHFAATPDEWVEAIDYALTPASPETVEKRISTARGSDWDLRVQQVRDALVEGLSRDE